MRRKKHKRKINHVVIVTSDAVETSVKQYRVKQGGLWVLIVLLCLVIGGMVGYIYYEQSSWESMASWKQDQMANIKSLEEQKEELEAEKLALAAEIAGLNENIQLLSETVNLKTKSEAELAEQLAKQSRPTEFPLSGSASMEEEELDGNPICVFTAAEGITVVATASGIVTAVNDDVQYGHIIWVDHGNGYVTIYRNGGEPNVKAGDSVVCGTSLYVIGNGHEKLGYQMMNDGEYINPMDMLAISG